MFEGLLGNILGGALGGGRQSQFFDAQRSALQQQAALSQQRQMDLDYMMNKQQQEGARKSQFDDGDVIDIEPVERWETKAGVRYDIRRLGE